MSFHAQDVAHDLIKSLRPVMERLVLHDRKLAEQVRGAASSTGMNIDEGRRRVGRDRLHSWRIAAGSAAEVRCALRIADAWGYLSAELIEEPLRLLDRVLAMLWKMTHPASGGSGPRAT